MISIVFLMVQLYIPLCLNYYGMHLSPYRKYIQSLPSTMFKLLYKTFVDNVKDMLALHSTMFKLLSVAALISVKR